MAKHELTPRQYRLHDFILENSKGRFLSRKDIVKESALYGELADGEKFHNTMQARDLTRDLQALNETEEFHHVFISVPGKGVKYAEKGDEKHLVNMFNSRLESLKRLRSQLKKGARDGHFRLVFNKEKGVHEAYIG